MFSPFSGDPRSVRRPDFLPRSKRPCYDVYRVTPGSTHELAVVSSHLEEVLVHAVDGRTQPCTGRGADCWLSHAEYATRWQGWLFVRDSYKQPLRLLCLTPFACEVEPRLLDPAQDLRGLVLKLWRADSRIRSRMHATFSGTWTDTPPLPPAPDLIQQLGALWSAPPRKCGPADRPKELREAADRYRDAASTAEVDRVMAKLRAQRLGDDPNVVPC